MQKSEYLRRKFSFFTELESFKTRKSRTFVRSLLNRARIYVASIASGWLALAIVRALWEGPLGCPSRVSLVARW